LLLAAVAWTSTKSHATFYFCSPIKVSHHEKEREREREREKPCFSGWVERLQRQASAGIHAAARCGL